MAVCYNCKTEFTGKFCPTCGAAAQAGPAPAPVQVAPRVAPPVYTNVSVAPPATATSVMGWIGWMLLCSCLPVLGVIIMALAATDPSAKNFAKAQLLVMLIVLIISLLIVGGMLLLGIGLGAAANQ
ncbi:MAG: hypothetical protein Q4A05_08510 [Ruminococcus sp.]|nr:hypothetical protein [Ruminococcus sp.]